MTPAEPIGKSAIRPGRSSVRQSKVVDPPTESSPGTWRGDWVRDRRRLQVVARDSSHDEGDATHTQLDLVLLDDAGDSIPIGGTIAA